MQYARRRIVVVAIMSGASWSHTQVMVSSSIVSTGLTARHTRGPDIRRDAAGSNFKTFGM